jgi:Zn-dependent peptidase ImmA (M78 family)
VADRAGGPQGLIYDPGADLALRYPDWLVADGDLGGVVPEVLCLVRRVILIEQDQHAAAKRSSLAHAIAHLDLGHRRVLAGFFENREEAEADQLAARRLIPLASLAHVLTWTRSPGEVAAELDVDAQTLRVREHALTRAERRVLRRAARH